VLIIIITSEDNHLPPILPRAVAPLLDVALSTMRVVVISGPRQAGKSTLATHHPKLASRPYLSLDDDATLLRMQADRRAFLNSEPELIIDEVRRDPPLILAIKVAVDQQRPQKRGQFVLTGSANLLLMKHVSDSLAGRAYYLNLQTLTRREQQGLGAAGIWTRFFETSVADWLEMVRAERAHHEDWRDAVKRGGFPAVALEDTTSSNARSGSMVMSPHTSSAICAIFNP
jgi:uncharacterized protein